MGSKLLGRWIKYLLLDLAISIIPFLWLFPIFQQYTWIILVIASLVVSLLQLFQYFFTNESELKKKAEVERKKAEVEKEIYRRSLLERSAGFPTLLRAISEFDKIQDEELRMHLIRKKHPGSKSAEIVKEETKKRREAEYNNRKTQAILEYYESIAPFLVDLKNEVIDEDNDDKYREYDETEQLDYATHYLTKEEYRKLTPCERNQMALDRFWKRHPKPKQLLGRIYERYIGYLYEAKGYDVKYTGIIQSYEDLGRDLICKKGRDVIIIQCKNWSQFKTIYEKHIFQFFGTVYQYKYGNRDKNVQGFFYTTTKVSDLARSFAIDLDINLLENYKMKDDYPSIKCNISKSNGEKIYHLPFDQQYDKIKIEYPRGEFYCKTTKEAEQCGFRRAFKYTGLNNS